MYCFLSMREDNKKKNIYIYSKPVPILLVKGVTHFPYKSHSWDKEFSSEGRGS